MNNEYGVTQNHRVIIIKQDFSSSWSLSATHSLKMTFLHSHCYLPLHCDSEENTKAKMKPWDDEMTNQSKAELQDQFSGESPSTFFKLLLQVSAQPVNHHEPVPKRYKEYLYAKCNCVIKQQIQWCEKVFACFLIFVTIKCFRSSNKFKY